MQSADNLASALIVKIDRKNFPRRLRKARKGALMTQTALAERLRVTRAAISNWERGEALPEMPLAEATARALGISLDWLLTGKGPMSISGPGSKSVTAGGHMNGYSIMMMTVDRDNFPERLKAAREARGFFSQAELADELEITRAAVSRWERGQSLPDNDRAEQLADTLAIPLLWLMAGKGAAPGFNKRAARKSDD